MATWKLKKANFKMVMYTPIVLSKAPNFGKKFFFSTDENLSNYYIKKFFRDMGNIVKRIDPDVIYSQENVMESSSLFGKIKQMKSSFYVCAYEFKVGDIMRKHDLTFFRKRKYPFILNFGFKMNVCDLNEAIIRNAEKLDYIGILLEDRL